MDKKKRYVIGDIHGGYKGMLQCFARAGFNYYTDELYCLGDVCDGWSDVQSCINELLKITHLYYIMGNHDLWFLDWSTKPRATIWDIQGGKATFHSYIPKSHIDLFRCRAYLWYELENMLFVHGGFDPSKSMDKQSKDVLVWDRDLLRVARLKHNQKPNFKYGGYKEIFIGHTTTLIHKTTEPLHYCNVWNLDTGGGWGGKITIMDIDSKQYWQSDFLTDLYPDEKGR